MHVKRIRKITPNMKNKDLEGGKGGVEWGGLILYRCFMITERKTTGLD